MQENNDAQMKKEEREQLVELGSDLTKSGKYNIYTLTIIGQVEGHQVLPENAKTTKYEHVLPLLAGIEESEEIDGLLLLLNTVGGDIEAVEEDDVKALKVTASEDGTLGSGKLIGKAFVTDLNIADTSKCRL